MTTISSTNNKTVAVSNAMVTKTSKLSETTKSELEALGISATDSMTEAEAQQLIQAAKTEKQAETGGGKQQDSSTESEILSDAKTLAARVGISVSSDDDIEGILDDIGEKLEVMLEEAEHNPSVLSTLSSYFGQLTNLDDRYDSLQSFQNNLFSAMNMVSTNNKIALGL